MKCVIQTENPLSALHVGQSVFKPDLRFVHFIISHVHSTIHSSQWRTQTLTQRLLNSLKRYSRCRLTWRAKTKWMRLVQLLNRPLIRSNRSVCVYVWLINVLRSKWTTSRYRLSSGEQLETRNQLERWTGFKYSAVGRDHTSYILYHLGSTLHWRFTMFTLSEIFKTQDPWWLLWLHHHIKRKYFRCLVRHFTHVFFQADISGISTWL